MTPHIRWMIRRDMSGVLEIENASYQDPWSEEDFIRYLRQRNCIGVIAEDGDLVAGFMLYELHKTRLGILNLAVHPSHRRNGVGRQLLGWVVSRLSVQGRTMATLDVRETNLHGQCFLRSMGFKAVNVIRDRYLDEDAYHFVYRLGQLTPAEPISVRIVGA